MLKNEKIEIGGYKFERNIKNNFYSNINNKLSNRYYYTNRNK